MEIFRIADIRENSFKRGREEMVARVKYSHEIQFVQDAGIMA